MKYVTWNQFSLTSIQQAERRKQALEADGWTLIHETVGCLTYSKDEAAHQKTLDELIELCAAYERHKLSKELAKQ